MAEKRSQGSVPGDVEKNIKKAKLDLTFLEEKSGGGDNLGEPDNHEGKCENISLEDKQIKQDVDQLTDNVGQKHTHQVQTEHISENVDQNLPAYLNADADTSILDAKDKPQPALLDPLSYTKNDEFTSEIFKIQIHNLPKFGFNDLKKRLKSHLQLKPHKIKSNKRYVTYVCFKNETDRDEAIQKINGHVWKGKTLQAKIAAPVADPYLQKRHQEKGDDQLEHTLKSTAHPTENKKMNLEEAEARLRANVSPLWETEYDQQLQIKTENVKDVLKRVTRNNFVKHLFRDRSIHDGLACELLPIIPSPVTSEYRNKNEFTVGYGLDGQVMVGFRYGMYKDGTTAVGDSTTVGMAMPAAIPVVKSFREFISQSKWLPFRQETGSGHWQTLTVRTFQTGDVMAVIDFVPRNLEQAEIECAKSSLKEFYTVGEGKDVKITSFYFRVMGGKGQTVKPSSELLFGGSHVYESLLNLRFRISPEAFFQVNTAATEKLYQLISDWCNVSSSSTVLDICCGTGTIGLSMAKNVKEVIGIEMCPEAVEDARVNASINGVSNATFHCAKVEDIINKVMPSVQSSTFDGGVAVVDPPRAGLHKDVIKTLRRCSSIQRLVYVSCNPDSALDNFVDLIRPETGRHKGAPFKMVKAVPVDLFPGTRHCELVILFTHDVKNSTADLADINSENAAECIGNSSVAAEIQVKIPAEESKHAAEGTRNSSVTAESESKHAAEGTRNSSVTAESESKHAAEGTRNSSVTAESESKHAAEGTRNSSVTAESESKHAAEGTRNSSVTAESESKHAAEGTRNSSVTAESESKHAAEGTRNSSVTAESESKHAAEGTRNSSVTAESESKHAAEGTRNSSVTAESESKHAAEGTRNSSVPVEINGAAESHGQEHCKNT